MGIQSKQKTPVRDTTSIPSEKRSRAARTAVRISLVIPVYNAGEFIADNIRQAADYLAGFGKNNELIVVDDASTDGTGEVLKSIAPELSGVSYVVLHNKENQGKGFSVRRGMEVANGKHLIFNDADFTYPVEQVGIMSSYLEEGHDLVIGCRTHPESRYEIGPEFFRYFMTRHLMSRVFNFIVNLFLGLKIKDTQAGIKGFSRKAAKTIFAMQSMNRFSFDLEMLYIAREHGYRIEEAPIRFLYRKEPSTVKFFRDSLQILWDMVMIRWRGLRGLYRSMGS